MEDGLLSLKWNNHKTTFFDILRVLREKANYADATIAVEGKFYQVHKLVMSTCSEYFSEIFERTPCKSPVIVLKDVRSQDMDALLDYMYLGEVNVNQNDLASLLKTAECLRIKGLAVPDEDPTKHKKSHAGEDRRERDSPPPKRRRHDDAPRPSSPSSVTSPSKTTPSVQSSPHHAPSTVTCDGVREASVEPPPMVKVEMEEADEHDEAYHKDKGYDGGSVNEVEDGDYGVEVSKSEHDPDSYGGGSYPGPSLQQGGELPWDEGDSSSFPPEGFSGDLAGGQQPQGDQAAASQQGDVTSLRRWLQGALGQVQGTRLSPSALLKLGPVLGSGAGALPALSAAWEAEWGREAAGGSLHRPRSSSTPAGPSHSPPAPSPVPTAKCGLGAGEVAGLEAGPFSCTKCPDTFPLPMMLAMHSLNHVQERPFTCPYPSCHYNSVMRGNVKRHIRTSHAHHTFPV